MTREDARKAAEVMLAYADGKEVEVISSNGEWYNEANPSFNWGNNVREYRIKPSPTYRPFANAEECWEEMKKHQPFGWVKDDTGSYRTINYVKDNFVDVHEDKTLFFDVIFALYTFADGTPFGKLTEEG